MLSGWVDLTILQEFDDDPNMPLVTSTSMPASFGQFVHPFNSFGDLSQNSTMDTSTFMQPFPYPSMMFNSPAYPTGDGSTMPTRHNSTATTTSIGSLPSAQPVHGQLLGTGLTSGVHNFGYGGFEVYNWNDFSNIPDAGFNSSGANFDMDEFNF